MLLVAPQLLDVMLPVAGVVDLALPIPDVSVFVGLVLHQQVADFELDAMGALTAVTSTNALSMTVGGL